MKTTVFATVLSAAALCAVAQNPIQPAKYDPARPRNAQLAEHDAKKWGSTQIGGELLKLHGEMKSRVDRLGSALVDFSDASAFTSPDKDNLFQELYSAAGKSLRAGQLPNTKENYGKDDFATRGYNAVEGFHAFAGVLDKDVRPLLHDTMDLLAGREFPLVFNRWKKAIGTLEHLVFSTEFAKFDAVFGEWMADVETIRKNRVDDVLGTELMMKTKLDRYANGDCRPLGYLDGDARVVDKMLAVLREDERARFEDTVAQLSSRLAKLKERSQAAFAMWTGGFCSDVQPSDRNGYDDIFTGLNLFCAELEKALADAKKMLEKTADKSGEVGKLRSNTGFSPNGAFECAGATQSNGCPGYARRIRVALEDCKNAYLKAYRQNKGAAAKWE